MLETLKRWFGLTRQQKTNENALTPCYKSLADVPAALDLHDKTIVVCRGGSLVLRKEGELPDTLRAGEVCWIVPRGDVKLSLDFSFDNRQVRAAVTIRFESDAAFARYAKTQPSCITEETLARFVAGEWCELLSLQGIDVQNLTDAARASTFRTHLSLLLQENGFRCVALESIIVCEAKKTVVQDEPTEDMPVEIASEIQTLIEAANSEQKWDGFLDQLDEAGFRPSSVQAEQLATLGQNYRDKKIPLADAVLQVNDSPQQSGT